MFFYVGFSLCTLQVRGDGNAKCVSLIVADN